MTNYEKIAAEIIDAQRQINHHNEEQDKLARKIIKLRKELIDLILNF